MQESPNESDASASTLIIVIVYFVKYRFERAGAVFNVDTDMRSKYTDKSVK